jgi:hypothetical protein
MPGCRASEFAFRCKASELGLTLQNPEESKGYMIKTDKDLQNVIDAGYCDTKLYEVLQFLH